MIRKESPFYNIGSIIGERTKGRHITLQNLYRTLHLLTADYQISSLSKEEKLALSMKYYEAIKLKFPEEWGNYKGHRITHIVCLDALSMAGLHVLLKSLKGKKVELQAIEKRISRLSLDWSSQGPLKYLKGIGGSKTLAVDLTDQMIPRK